METLRQMLETYKKEAYESEHTVDNRSAEEVVAGLIRDYALHRDRIGSFDAGRPTGGDGVGREPQPSGVTLLTSP